MQVRGDRDRAFLVGGVDESVEPFGGAGSDREQADVIDDDQVGAGIEEAPGCQASKVLPVGAPRRPGGWGAGGGPSMAGDLDRPVGSDTDDHDLLQFPDPLGTRPPDLNMTIGVLSGTCSVAVSATSPWVALPQDHCTCSFPDQMSVSST